MPTVGMDHEARGSRRLDLELRLGQNTGGGVEAGEREAKAGGCDLTSQRLDFKTRNGSEGYFTEFLTISRCGAGERRRSARRVSRISHSTNWGFGAHQCPCMATRASAAFSSPPQGVLRSDRDRSVRIRHHWKTRLTVLDTIPSVVTSTVAVPASCTLGGRSTLTWSRPGSVGCMPAYWLASNCPLTVTVTGIE